MQGPFCLINHVKPDTFDLVLNGIVTPIVVVFGLLGNFYSLLRNIARDNFSKRLNTYLCAMCVWDVGVLVCVMGDYGVRSLAQLNSDTLFHYGIFAYLARYFHGFFMTAMTGSVWITVAIAVVRCRAVASPFQSLSARTVNARLACIWVSICAVIYSLPCHFEITVVNCFCNVTQSPSIQVYPNLFANNLYRTLYRSICYSLFVSGGPFFVILLLSLRTVSVVRASPTMGSRLHRGRRRVRLLFFLLLVKFLFTNFPSTAIMLATSIWGQQIMRASWGKYVVSSANLCALLHNATNFLVYVNPCLREPTRQSEGYREAISLLERSPTVPRARSRTPELVAFECKRVFEIFVMVTDGNESIFNDWLLKLSQEKSIEILENPDLAYFVASNIYRFLRSLISKMWHDPGCRWTITVRNMVRLHRTKEFQLSSETLDHFETFLVNAGHRSKYRLSTEDLELWKRFVGSVAAEMKLAIDY